MKRTRRDWGTICLGFAAGCLLGEVKQFWQPNQVAAWVTAAFTVVFLSVGLYLIRTDRPQ